MNESSTSTKLLPATTTQPFACPKEAPCGQATSELRTPLEPPRRAGDENSRAKHHRRSLRSIKQVWFIEGPHSLEKISGRILVKRRWFLQIGTGQWTSPEYATFFLRRKTATAYAREYGLLAEGRVRIVALPSDQFSNKQLQ